MQAPRYLQHLKDFKRRVPSSAPLRFRTPYPYFNVFFTKDYFLWRVRAFHSLKLKSPAGTLRNPARFADRAEPQIDTPLGAPPKWLKKKGEREAWDTLSGELPWLNSSHRTLVALACGILGRLIDGEEVGVKAVNLLRQMLNSMGATPSDASKLKVPVEKDE